jgi:hypothetical protein
MESCTNCVGRGLVSTGAVPQDLEVGLKVTCTVCNGTGQQPTVGAGSAHADDLQAGTAPESPKAQEPSPEEGTGEGSGVPLGIVPQVGDVCETDAGSPGVLQAVEGGGWVCVASE